MKVYGVIVTYGDRFNFLEKVINSCFIAGIKNVIVVDNNSEIKSKLKLKELEKKLGNKLKVIYLDKNFGSSGGFKKGLQEVYENDDCEYILTLDDDNVIAKNSLNKLQNILNYLDVYKNNIMLGMYRPIWDWDRKTIEKGWVKAYKLNNFMDFNFLTFLKRFMTKKIFKIKKINLFPLQPAEVSAMGGLFFPKNIIDKIGYPNEDFFVYADDHEYTYRFTKNGGKIFLCSEIMIEDIDQTSLNDNNESIGFFHKDFSEMKMYYTIRNHTYFSKEFITNRVFFYGNLGVLSLLYFRNIFKTSLPLFIKRYKLYLKAVLDGLNGKLGRTF
jgi:GT2 family glycosyltransferase